MGDTADPPRAVARWLRHRLPALLRAYGIDEAYLFGSWGRGDADAGSDIDLIVVAPSRRPFVDRFRDYPELWQTAPAGIDLLIYTPEGVRDAATPEPLRAPRPARGTADRLKQSSRAKRTAEIGSSAVGCSQATWTPTGPLTLFCKFARRASGRCRAPAADFGWPGSRAL
jgi:predicted nucleotidyltransferase